MKSTAIHPQSATGPDALEALANPVRRRIIEMLAQKPRAVGDLARHLPVSRPAVSKHLKLLQKTGFVVYQSSGTRNLYQLESSGFEAAHSWLDSFWKQGLDRFRLVAENTTPDQTNE